MQKRHLAPVLLILALGGCGEDGPGPKPASAPPSDPAGTAVSAVPSTVAPAAAAASAAQPQATVRTDDLDAALRAVDQELSGTQQSVNQANDTSPDRADD